MPTAWLILMNSRLSGLVQRLMKRVPSRTKSLGTSASSWRVSDMVRDVKREIKGVRRRRSEEGVERESTEEGAILATSISGEPEPGLIRAARPLETRERRQLRLHQTSRHRWSLVEEGIDISFVDTLAVLAAAACLWQLFSFPVSELQRASLYAHRLAQVLFTVGGNCSLRIVRMAVSFYFLSCLLSVCVCLS